MTDVLIRNVREEDLRRIDERARRLGLSRNEFLRRQIAQEAGRADNAEPLTMDVLQRFSALAVDLLDEDVMRDAWS